MKNRTSRTTIEAVHTHTHTHTGVSKKWSEGGSREQLEVSILPRDLI